MTKKSGQNWGWAKSMIEFVYLHKFCIWAALCILGQVLKIPEASKGLVKSFSRVRLDLEHYRPDKILVYLRRAVARSKRVGRPKWKPAGVPGGAVSPLAGSGAAPRKNLKNMHFLTTVSTIWGLCRLLNQSNREHSLLFVIAQKCIILL